jgi:lipopolysaccharide biosynthesis glycosyltransferase
MGWFTTATYARLLIPELLPESVSKALYMDCDLVARRCVGGLFDLPLEGRAALAVPDQGAAYVCCPWGLAHWYESGRAPSDFNFNAGVMLMDLELWRREKIGRQALEYVQSPRHQLNQDQEALNAIIGTRIGAVDPHWNQQGELFQKPAAIVLPYSRELVQSVVDDPWIIHYSLGTKPWHHGCEHPWVPEWFRYLDETVFKGWRPPAPPRRKIAIMKARNVMGQVARRLGLL